MQHIAEILSQCAELLTLLDPEVIEPAPPIADDWPETVPVVYGQEVGDA